MFNQLIDYSNQCLNVAMKTKKVKEYKSNKVKDDIQLKKIKTSKMNG
jgi:hypothetical protein